MHKKLFLMVPILISITGCNEPIETQKDKAGSSEVMAPSETEAEASGEAENQDAELKLRPPVGID